MGLRKTVAQGWFQTFLKGGKQGRGAEKKELKVLFYRGKFTF